jgi:hypothetical protein
MSKEVSVSFLSNIFSNIFSKKNAKTIHLDGLGQFVYCNDGTDEYWFIEQPVAKLLTKFDFGAISGSVEGPNPEALEAFRFYAEKPENLYSSLNELFYSKLKEKFGVLTIKDVQTDFYLKSLTCASREEFEFGFHSLKNDIFVELFCRGGSVTEVHLDEGCCE